jgi:hypothetical protein
VAIIGGMADPVTLALLGGAAATEGVKFLYAQAGEMLKAWRTRREERRKDALEVPIVETGALDAAPAGAEVDAEVLARHGDAMVELWARLAPYAQGLRDVDVQDQALAAAAGELRALLEAAYGRRFTFRGERREPTGARVTVEQALGTVAGAAVGVEGDVGAGADVAVHQEASEIQADGTVIGIKGRIGG